MSDAPKEQLQIKVRGRGAGSNDTSRFHKEKLQADLSDAGWIEEEDFRSLKTEFFKDTSKTVVAGNNSPDICFTYSINPYRGCEHGCAYCYARPTHEYLGLSAGLDFESKIFVKEDAPELLRQKLLSRSWEPQVIAISGVTDCYQPAEQKYQLTRGCLQVLAEFKNPASLITKNFLVTRDLDILSAMASDHLVSVTLSITTLNADLARTLEPRTSPPQMRLKAIERLAQAGVRVGVNVAPLIPGLNEHELPGILKAAADAGAQSAGYTPLRLPLAVKPIFIEWLEHHQPERKDKVLNAIRTIRDGQLNSAQFGDRMRGRGPRSDNMNRMFKIFCQKFGLNRESYKLRTDLFNRPDNRHSRVHSRDRD